MVGSLLNQELVVEEEVEFLPKSHLSCHHLCLWGRILNLPLPFPRSPLPCSEDLEAMDPDSCPASPPSSSLHLALQLALHLVLQQVLQLVLHHTASLHHSCLKVMEL